MVNMEDCKPDSKYRDICYVFMKHTSDNSFEIVNADDGSMYPFNWRSACQNLQKNKAIKELNRHCSSQILQKSHKILQL